MPRVAGDHVLPIANFEFRLLPTARSQIHAQENRIRPSVWGN
jgi:hypothetical protein